MIKFTSPLIFNLLRREIEIGGYKMKRLLNKYLKSSKLKEEEGSANTVSFIVIMFFVMVLLISMIDMGIYFNVKNEMRSAAEAGARNVALYGGTGGELRGVRAGVNDAEEVVEAAIQSNYKNESGKTPIVELGGIACEPNKTPHAGDKVSCSVNYKYNGIAGEFSLFRINGVDVTVKGTTVSEVGHRE